MLISSKSINLLSEKLDSCDEVFCSGLFLSARWFVVSQLDYDGIQLIVLPDKESAEYCAADLYNLVEGDCVFFLPDVLSMLDTEYVGLDRGDPAVAEVKASASVMLVVYEGQHEEATVYVTDGCRVLVEESDGGLWYAVTPGVDTVLICAEFTGR